MKYIYRSIKELIRFVINKIRVRSISDDFISFTKEHQMVIFDAMWTEVATFRDEVNKYQDHRYVDEMWEDWMRSIADIYRSKEALSRFSENPIIVKTMVGDPIMNRYKNQIASVAPEHRYLICEELFGNTRIINKELKYSGSRAGHLYVFGIINYLLKSKGLASMKIVELGGGFGGLMSIFIRVHPDISYTVYDLPVMLPLQFCYLNCVCRKSVDAKVYGKDMFKYVSEIEPQSARGSVFISNWAVTEANQALQELMMSTNMFGASAAIICCEDANENHSKSTVSHQYIKSKASFIHRLEGPMSNSNLYFIDFRLIQ